MQDTFPSPHSHTHPRPRFVALEAICFGASNSTTCLGRREGCCRPPSSTSSHRPTHVRHFAPPPRSSPPFGGTATRTGTHSDFARFPHTHRHTHTRKRTRLSYTARRKPTLNVAGSYPLFRCLLCVCLLSKRAAKCFHAVKKLACCCLRPCPKVATGPRSTSGQQWAVPSCVQNHQTKPQCSQLAFSKPRP